MWAQKQKGFTVVELVVVVAVIGILAAVTLVAYDNVQARSRDSIRMDNLRSIKDALTLHYIDNKNWVETGSGCGYNGEGGGWFSYTNSTTYSQSIANCLKTGGYAKEEISDPSGTHTSSPSTGYAYMKYHCGTGSSQRVYVYAKLERLPQSTTATDGTCSNTLDTSYGMNYYIQVK